MDENQGWFGEVLKALAGAYGSGCNYPWSPSVKNGLKRVLHDRYKNNSEMFKDKFVHPTLYLLSRLKVKNFPLCLPGGQVVVHLAPVENRLFIGEFYYQVGHTKPGSLAVKFAKYRDNRGSSVVQQPSEVGDGDYDIAFTKEYFADVRRRAEGAGDVLMRTLVVLCPPDWTASKIDAASLLQNCPPDRRGRLKSDSHLSVQESGDDESSESIEPNSPSEHVEFKAITEDYCFYFDSSDTEK